MNYFRGNLFEYVKERRNAAFFFGTLVAIFGMLVACVFIHQIADHFDLLPYWPFVLAGIGLWLLTSICLGLMEMRARRLNRYNSSPLSRDEIAKARSKLTKKPIYK